MADGAVVPPVKGLVHLQHEVGGHQIVRVEDEVGVVPVPALPGQGAEQVVQGVALALLHLVEPLVHDGPGPAGHLGGVVGAVVGHHVHVQQAGGVVLLFQAVDQFSNDPRLVPGGDDGGVPVVPDGLRLLPAAALHQSDHQVNQLIKIGHGEQNS